MEKEPVIRQYIRLYENVYSAPGESYPKTRAVALLSGQNQKDLIQGHWHEFLSRHIGLEDNVGYGRVYFSCDADTYADLAQHISPRLSKSSDQVIRSEVANGKF